MWQVRGRPALGSECVHWLRLGPIMKPRYNPRFPRIPPEADVKNVREFYKQCFENEKPTFLKVMRAVPPDQNGYTPHPRSTNAGDLMWLLAAELEDACTLIDSGEVNYVYRPSPGVAASIAAYEKHAGELQKRLATLDDAKWDSP